MIPFFSEKMDKEDDQADVQKIADFWTHNRFEGK